MRDSEASINPEQRQSYDWTHGRAQNQYGDLIATPEEEAWWDNTASEMTELRKGELGGARTLAYLTHPVVGPRLIMWAQTELDRVWDRKPPVILDAQFEPRSHHFAFTKEWLNKLQAGDFPSKEQLDQDPYGLGSQLWGEFVQNAFAVMKDRMPYIGMVSLEEAQQAMQSYFDAQLEKMINQAENRRTQS